MAIVLGTVERLIMIAFKFVPLRLGVDHAGSGSIAEVLGIGSPVGVTIATVRTARNLFWAAVGLAMLARNTQETKDLQKSAGPDGLRRSRSPALCLIARFLVLSIIRL